MAGGDQGLPIVHRDPREPLLRHDPTGGAAPVDRRYAVGGVSGEVLGQLRRRRGLEPQVHFYPHGRGESFDHFDGLQAPQLGLGTLDQERQPAHEVDVAGKCALNPGAQYLDRHEAAFNAFALGSRGIVDLCD